MNEITVSAKTLDDAITEASIQLGVTSSEMEYDVIEKGSAGFLGIGSRQAVIRARKKVEEKPEVKKEHKKDSKKDFKKDRKNHKEYKEHKEHSEQQNVPKTESEKEVKKEEPVEVKETAAPVKQEKKELDIAVVTEETRKICEAFLADVLKAMGIRCTCN